MPSTLLVTTMPWISALCLLRAVGQTDADAQAQCAPEGQGRPEAMARRAGDLLSCSRREQPSRLWAPPPAGAANRPRSERRRETAALAPTAATAPAPGAVSGEGLGGGKLKGKKALVFGGTSGIGLAAARQLSELGAVVVAIGRDPSKAETIEGVQYEQCDVLDREGLAKLFDRHAPFDILVSTATGGTRAIGPFLEMDLDGFQASFDKLWGYANVVRLGAPHLAKAGCIVLVSGTPARRAKPGQIALSSVGASVEQFARVLAAELAPRRINVVCPGIIETPMFGQESEERASRLADATSGHLVPRPGRADEVAKAILFTIESDFVTGTTVDVDGGWLAAL